MLLKEIKDTNKWKVILYSWIRRLNIVQMIIAPKVMYKVSALPIKIPINFFAERKIYFKIHMESEEIQIAKTTLKKKNKIEDLKLLNLRTYCRDSILPMQGAQVQSVIRELDPTCCS